MCMGSITRFLMWNEPAGGLQESRFQLTHLPNKLANLFFSDIPEDGVEQSLVSWLVFSQASVMNNVDSVTISNTLLALQNQTTWRANRRKRSSG